MQSANAKVGNINTSVTAGDITIGGGENIISSKQDNVINIPNNNSNDEILNGGDFTSDLSIATLNVNSLFKAENIEHRVFKRKNIQE